MIIATCASHGSVINALAAEGKLRRVTLTLPDGTKLECNSAWAATDYLKSHEGTIDRSHATIS